MGDGYFLDHAPSQLYTGTVGFPTYVNAIVLGSGTAESYVVPAGSKFCLITSTLPWWGRIGGTAVAGNTTEVTDGTASFYVPAGLQCKLSKGQTLSAVRATAASTEICIAHYD